MRNAVIDAQFMTLRQEPRFADAELVYTPDLTCQLFVGFALVTGWSVGRALVRTTLPVGYPLAAPADFSTDPHLRWGEAVQPRHTYLRQDGLLFLLRPMAWSPNQHTLLTWCRMIGVRLQREKEEVCDD